jgi:NAD(P)-dependent dehydrogenase (short-subunit alcohol dehydrogenase family)
MDRLAEAATEPSRILITASLAGLVTFPGGGAYAATKHAVVAVAEQAAMALLGTDVSVTLVCPALVCSGMSDVGEHPDDVAMAALDAAEAGTFLVVPDEWTHAMTTRTHRLVSGRVPETPPTAPEGPRHDRTAPKLDQSAADRARRRGRSSLTIFQELDS